MSEPHGLVTLALLKALYDHKRDHIEMLLPLVCDGMRCLPSNDFACEQLRDVIFTAHGLVIPDTVLRTVLERARRKRFVLRQGGRYFRQPICLDQPDVAKKRREIADRQTTLGRTLADYLRRSGWLQFDEVAALGLLLGFFEEHLTWFLLDASAGVDQAPPITSSRTRTDARLDRAIAQFLVEFALGDETTRALVDEIVSGFVLQNVFFLRDISQSRRRFKDLKLFFDSGILLQILGMEGRLPQTTSTDVLRLVRDAGAHVGVFEDTIEEIQRILSVYSHRLLTPGGVTTLRQTPLTRHILTSRMSASDIRELSALLPEKLRRLGFRIVQRPKHDRRFTLNEEALQRELRPDSRDDIDDRVIHDVNCVAAILTMRRGRSPVIVEAAEAVFVTSSASVVSSVAHWYRSETGKFGISPVMHVGAISSLAWIKSGTADISMKIHEVAALCLAVLRPSRDMWQAFTNHLRKLRERGEITTDEMVAIVASELTDATLGDFVGSFDSDAETLEAVVERVRQSYRDESQRKIKEVEVSAQSVIQSVRAQAADEILAEQSNRKIVERELAEKHLRESDREQRAQKVAGLVGSFCGWVVFTLLGAFTIIGPPAALIHWLRPMWASVASVASCVSAVWGLWGLSARDIRDTISIRVERRLLNKLGYERHHTVFPARTPGTQISIQAGNGFRVSDAPTVLPDRSPKRPMVN